MSAQHLQSVSDNEEEPEGPARSSRGNGGSDIERRLAALETHMQYLATKEDLQKLEVWFLQAMIGAMVAIVSLTIGILKFFF